MLKCYLFYVVSWEDTFMHTLWTVKNNSNISYINPHCKFVHYTTLFWILPFLDFVIVLVCLQFLTSFLATEWKVQIVDHECLLKIVKICMYNLKKMYPENKMWQDNYILIVISKVCNKVSLENGTSVQEVVSLILYFKEVA